MGKRRGVYMVLVGKTEGGRPFESSRRRIILKWIFKNWVVDRSGLGYKHVAVSFECGNKSSGSIKCGEFVE
jgi:hypothetical protein